MSSMRDDIAIAKVRKQVPDFKDGSMLDLGLKLRIPKPISLKAIDNALKNLPAAVLTFFSEELGPSTVTASAQVGLQSDGKASFRGTIHESGAIGHFYLLVAAFLDVKDEAGNTLVFPVNGKVHGLLDSGSPDDHWQIDGFQQIIADQWDTIKKGNVQFKLHTSTDVLPLIKDILIGLLAIAGAAMFGSDKCIKSTWSSNDESGNPGPVLHLERDCPPT